MSKIFTLTLNTKGEESVEVDYDLKVFIHEIRVWSDFFEAFVPVSELWMKANFPVRYNRILNAVYSEAHMNRQPRPKDFNNDGPEAA